MPLEGPGDHGGKEHGHPGGKAEIGLLDQDSVFLFRYAQVELGFHGFLEYSVTVDVVPEGIAPFGPERVNLVTELYQGIRQIVKAVSGLKVLEQATYVIGGHTADELSRNVIGLQGC